MLWRLDDMNPFNDTEQHNIKMSGCGSSHLGVEVGRQAGYSDSHANQGSIPRPCLKRLENDTFCVMCTLL